MAHLSPTTRTDIPSPLCHNVFLILVIPWATILPSLINWSLTYPSPLFPVLGTSLVCLSKPPPSLSLLPCFSASEVQFQGILSLTSHSLCDKSFTEQGPCLGKVLLSPQHLELWWFWLALGPTPRQRLYMGIPGEGRERAIPPSGIPPSH